jgi:hypothetical protein
MVKVTTQIRLSGMEEDCIASQDPQCTAVLVKKMMNNIGRGNLVTYVERFCSVLPDILHVFITEMNSCTATGLASS